MSYHEDQLLAALLQGGIPRAEAVLIAKHQMVNVDGGALAPYQIGSIEGVSLSISDDMLASDICEHFLGEDVEDTIVVECPICGEIGTGDTFEVGQFLFFHTVAHGYFARTDLMMKWNDDDVDEGGDQDDV